MLRISTDLPTDLGQESPETVETEEPSVESIKDKLINLILRITQQDIERFRQFVLPDALSVFDRTREDMKIKMVAIHSLTPKERAFIAVNRDFAQHKVGLHILKDVNTDYLLLTGKKIS